MENPTILSLLKKSLGINPEYQNFDEELIMHANSVFSTLFQLGVGPKQPFQLVSGEETWSDFLQDETRINSVKTYMYLKVRLLFDPPSNSFVVDSFQKQIDEYEWRLNVAVDHSVDKETESS